MQTFRMKRPRQKRREELAISSKLRIHGLPGMLNDLFKTDLWLWLQKFLWISQEQLPKKSLDYALINNIVVHFQVSNSLIELKDTFIFHLDFIFILLMYICSPTNISLCTIDNQMDKKNMT